MYIHNGVTCAFIYDEQNKHLTCVWISTYRLLNKRFVNTALS